MWVFVILMSLYLYDMKIIINESQLRLITENQIVQGDPARDAHFKSSLDILNTLKVGDKWPQGMKPPGDFRIIHRRGAEILRRSQIEKYNNDVKVNSKFPDKINKDVYDSLYVGFCKYASEFEINVLRVVVKIPSVKVEFEDLKNPSGDVSLDERSRTLANTRKKRLFPKNAKKYNPDRFSDYEKSK